MTDGLSASRQQLEAERRKVDAELTATEKEMVGLTDRLDILQTRRDHLTAKREQLGVGIRALHAAARDEQTTPAEEPAPTDTEEGTDDVAAP